MTPHNTSHAPFSLPFLPSSYRLLSRHAQAALRWPLAPGPKTRAPSSATAARSAGVSTRTASWASAARRASGRPPGRWDGASRISTSVQVDRCGISVDVNLTSAWGHVHSPGPLGTSLTSCAASCCVLSSRYSDPVFWAAVGQEGSLLASAWDLATPVLCLAAAVWHAGARMLTAS